MHTSTTLHRNWHSVVTDEEQVHRPNFFPLCHIWFSQLHFHFSINRPLDYEYEKYPEHVLDHHQNLISPVRDWRSTPLQWLSSTRDLDLWSGHTAYRRASLIDLYLHTKFHWNRKNFLVDGLSAGTSPSSRLCDTKSRKNIKNLAWPNLDIVL